MSTTHPGRDSGVGTGSRRRKTVPALQFELGLAGLALLRQWLVGEDTVTEHVLRELLEIASSTQGQLNWTRAATDYSPEAAYEAWAETYDAMPNPLIDAEAVAVYAELRDIPPGHAADVACGTGRHTRMLLSLGHRVTAIDSSMPMLRRVPREPLIAVVQGDALHLPFNDQGFDLVLCALLASHLSGLGALVRELARLVRPGGHLVLSDIHPWAVALGAHAMFRTTDGSLGYLRKHIHWLSSYLQAFRESGLEVLGCAEPAYTPVQAITVLSDLAVSATTATAALSGLPVALVWKLRRL